MLRMRIRARLRHAKCRRMMCRKNTTTRTGRRLSLESSFRACLTISETNPEPGLSTMSAGGVPFSVILLPMFTLAEERKQSHCNRCPVKLGECEAVKRLVERPMLVPQNANGHRFAKQQRLEPIRSPMHSGHIAAQSDIVGKFVEFTAHR